MNDESDPMTQPKWHTVTGPLAYCTVCPLGSTVVYHGDGDRSARRAIAFARKHVRETGHEVIVERGQSMRVRP
jgi:hypothetical protein